MVVNLYIHKLLNDQYKSYVTWTINNYFRYSNRLEFTMVTDLWEQSLLPAKTVVVKTLST